MEGTVIADLTAKLEALERQEQGLLCQEEENHLKRRISKKRKAIEDLGQASFKNLPRKIYQRWIQAVLKAELPWTISWLVGMLRLHNQHYLQKTQGPEERCLSLEHQNPSKTSEKWVILIALTIALQFRYTFCIPQTKRLRARKIGLQYKIRKGRKQIWGRFSNPWNSNGIEWNRLILLTWSRILMYLPNTVGKRHKKAFKFIFGDRNLWLRNKAFVSCAPQQMVTEMT